ncbi:glutamate--cysteine ligase (plasmid) [Nicoliella spurrieriana]|uniref:Glutamate--cysteine ligase n=1 Tax=Nicoliella spurrieriana TaxID=2925830 RepID=A0A976RQQ8_9LACO|nr:glutamate--cysteine ligase [Nicoliella spurrieriana]UQS86096.1 glutamate--cysteine ligase [Nicoliella spurrieriana]
MLNEIGKAIVKNQLVAKVTNIGTGIEVERDRVDQNGHLSRHPYPSDIGNEATNPWITNDFLETMSEVVTPPAKNDLDTLHYSYAITLILRKALANDELLWPLSMPPVLPEVKDKSLLAKASPKKRKYIEGLYHRYGVAKQTPSGVHINVSLDSEIIDFLMHSFHDQFSDRVAVQNYVYPIIAQGFIKYRWLLTYLFGASPVAQDNYFEKGKGPNHPIRSIRQSSYGYPTSFSVDYSSVEKYAEKIMNAVREGKIMAIAEFYGAVRFKGSQDLNDLVKNGIKYIELRMFDLDPTVDVALRTSTLRFVKLLMIYFVMVDPIDRNDAEADLARAEEMNSRVATEMPTSHCEYESEARKLVANLREFVNYLELGPEYLEILDQVERKIDTPTLTISGYLFDKIKDGSLLEYGIERAKQYQADGLAANYYFKGFAGTDGDVDAETLKQGLFDGNWQSK